LRRIDGLDTVIFSGIFGGYLALIISLVVTSYWKISLHTLGIASLTGLFLGAIQDKYLEQSSAVLILFVLIGLMGTSRLILKQHTPLQVYAGGVLGFIVPYVFVLNGWYL
jgi:membrane-associated phospholipid phosphatase